MGSVKNELKNDGRGIHQWDYLPLSDPHVVKSCIENRSKVDLNYRCEEPWAKEWNLPNGVTESMPDPIALTYIDLDGLIERAPLTENQRKVITLVMMGYTTPDIAENLLKHSNSIVYRHYRDAIKVICKQANTEWYKIYSV